MKKIALTAALVFTLVHCQAQQKTHPFRGYLYNAEYEVFLRIDFYNQSVSVPGNELYGQLPGYLGKKNNSFCWAITDAAITGDDMAELSLINDYGSEDLKATLHHDGDSLYTLKQGRGNTLKVPKNGKWQKLPKTLPFIRK